MIKSPLPALMPRGAGHQFAFYGDSCSGVPGAPHAANLARINAVMQRLAPAPEFVIFPGDEIIGLVPDAEALRTQWQHFLQVEMAWLTAAQIPMYNTTGNHTTYDRTSEAVFAQALPHLPRNGPADQPGLSYFIRRGDLLLVFVHTLWSGLGGEGHMELDWLRDTLAAHADARWTFVVGHHPAFPVNGYAGPYQRTIGAEYVAPFWQLLTQAGVTAYLCSHILAFDVQCHDGVLQITSAGAGTAHRMPEGIEYLHGVQMAVDAHGLRYQVLDDTGTLREALSWPPTEPKPAAPLAPLFTPLANPLAGQAAGDLITRLVLRGLVQGDAPRQTILAATEEDGTCPLWIGLVGRQHQLTFLLHPAPGRSPHRWLGPCFAPGDRLEIDLLLHGQMGPGGFLWRPAGHSAWTGLQGSAAWGLERLVWPGRLWVGQDAADADTRFLGDLSLSLGSVPTDRLT